MKVTTLFLFGLQAMGVLSTALKPNLAAGLVRDIPENRAALEAECGEFGIMDVPEGADASEVRHCAGHPAGRERFPDIDGNFPTGYLAAMANDNSDTAADENITSDNEVDDRRDPPTAAPMSSDTANPSQLFSRAAQKCWDDPNNKFGCSKTGWCWSNCVPINWPPAFAHGMWCWMAWRDGKGDWTKCKSKKDCELARAIGDADCSTCTNSGSCGCSC